MIYTRIKQKNPKKIFFSILLYTLKARIRIPMQPQFQQLSTIAKTSVPHSHNPVVIINDDPTLFHNCVSTKSQSHPYYPLHHPIVHAKTAPSDRWDFSREFPLPLMINDHQLLRCCNHSESVWVSGWNVSPWNLVSCRNPRSIYIYIYIVLFPTYIYI